MALGGFEFSAFEQTAFDTDGGFLPFGETLTVIVDTLPDTLSGYAQRQSFRLYAGADELHFSDFQYTADPNRIDFELRFTLVDMAQRALLTTDKNFKFDVYDAGAWRTEFETGKLLNRDFSVLWGDNAPNDTLEITIKSNAQNKFEKCPVLPLVIFDPNRADVAQEDFEVLKDTEGNAFVTTLEPVSGLTLHKLFERIFVEELGFSAYKTNLPDYNVRRVDFPLTETFFAPLAQLVAAFDALVFEQGDTIFVLDATQTLPNGFPAPSALTVADYARLEASSDLRAPAAYLMDYTANENEYDSTEDEVLPMVETKIGMLGDADYSTTQTVTTMRHFYKDEFPLAPVRSEIKSVVKTVRQGTTIVSVQTDERQYDSRGRLVRGTITHEGLVPTFEGGWSLALEDIETEELEIYYAKHPFKPSESIQKKLIRRTSGLIAVDAANGYLGDDFRQGFLDAYRAGNISEDVTYQSGAIKTVEETLMPTGKESLMMMVQTIDHVRGAVSLTYEEPRAGDIGQSDYNTETKPVIVLPEDGGALSGGRVEPFSVGEIPLEYAVPMARRRLKRRREKPYTFQADIFGFVRGISRGQVKALKDREGALVGVVMIEGFSISGKALGTPQREIITTIQGGQI